MQWSHRETLRRFKRLPFSDGSLKTQLAIIFGASVLLITTGYYFVLVPRITQLNTHRQYSTQLETLWQQKNHQIRSLHEQKRASRSPKEITQSTLPLITTPLFTLIHQATTLHRVHIERLHITKESTPSPTDEQTLQLILSGHNQALANFVREVTTFPYRIRLEKLALSYSKTQHLLLTTQLKVWVAPLPETRHVMALATDSSPTYALSHYEISQLSLIGTVEQYATWKGLVRTPDGKIHTVLPGSTIGPRSTRVIAIQQNGLVLEEYIEQANGLWSKRRFQLLFPERE